MHYKENCYFNSNNISLLLYFTVISAALVNMREFFKNKNDVNKQLFNNKGMRTILMGD